VRTRITKSRPKSLEATDVLAPRIIKSIAGSALRTRENDVRKNALLQAVGRLVLVGRLAFMVAPLVAGGVRRHSQVAAVPSNLGSCPSGLEAVSTNPSAPLHHLLSSLRLKAPVFAKSAIGWATRRKGGAAMFGIPLLGWRNS